jgi:hypothetical protein
MDGTIAEAVIVDVVLEVIARLDKILLLMHLLLFSKVFKQANQPQEGVSTLV